MLCLAAACLMLQTNKLHLRQLWDIPWNAMVGTVEIDMGYAPVLTGNKYRFLCNPRPNTDLREWVCDLDLETGQITYVNDFPKDLKIGTANYICLYEVFSDGNIQQQANARSIIDPVSGDSLIVLAASKQGLIPDDANVAARIQYPKGFKLVIPSLGPITVILDEPKVRMVVAGNRLLSCKPGTWQVDKIVIPNVRPDSWSTEVKGDPATGPFAVSYYDEAGQDPRDPKKTVYKGKVTYFDVRWKEIETLQGTRCVDAGPHGFLVEANGDHSRLFELLDPGTGKEVWSLKNPNSFANDVWWCGNYIVFERLRPAPKGNSVTLCVLDSETGENVAEFPITFPLATPYIYQTVGDEIIFHSEGKFSAYRLES